METKNLVIVGAGWRGLAMAKTYHQAHQDADVLILDEAESVGGVWAEERVYGGLHTNNPLGTYEFSDFPMSPEIAGCKPFEPIPGTGVHRYLCEAARFFDLEQYLRLGSKVVSARLRDDELWEITCASSKNPQSESTILARRLVVATGLASELYMPSLPGEKEFRGLIMHAKQLKARSQELSQARNVMVLGGNKSAYDVCYQVAQKGGVAHMMLRPSGGGPSFQWPSLMSLFGRVTALPVLTATRFFTLFDPWPFERKTSWIREYLHRWGFGLKITRTFWDYITTKYVERLNTDERTRMLVPWTSAYWMGTSLGTLNYPADWHQLVREGRIVIHHADIVSLSSTSVEMTDGVLDDVDAMVCCTGWRSIPSIKFLPEDMELGLASLPEKAGEMEGVMLKEARSLIYGRRPFLKSQPRRLTERDGDMSNTEISSPCRLYRYIIPPTEQFLKSRNLAFFAADNPLHFVAAAQIQALWITAFFDGKLPHLSPGQVDVEKVRNDTVLLTEYERIRHPKIAGGVGERYGEFVFDCLPYMDLLLQDTGLRTHRKSTMWKEWSEPYGLADYKGLVDEWLRSQS